MKQMTIFDILQEQVVEELTKKPLEVTLEVGDRVKVKTPADFTVLDVETSCHLEKFGGLVGKVVEIHHGKEISYCVETAKGRNYFYDAELSFLG